MVEDDKELSRKIFSRESKGREKEDGMLETSERDDRRML